MTFYSLSPRASQDPLHFCCQLGEKVYLSGHRLHIHCLHEAEARQLDRLLWTFRDGSFLPHGLLPDAAATEHPVLIGWTGMEPDPGGEEVLMNLADQPPAFLERFQRVLEIAPAEPRRREQARARYKFYQSRGYPLEHHEIA